MSMRWQGTRQSDIQKYGYAHNRGNLEREEARALRLTQTNTRLEEGEYMQPARPERSEDPEVNRLQDEYYNQSKNLASKQYQEYLQRYAAIQSRIKNNVGPLINAGYNIQAEHLHTNLVTTSNQQIKSLYESHAKAQQKLANRYQHDLNQYIVNSLVKTNTKLTEPDYNTLVKAPEKTDDKEVNALLGKYHLDSLSTAKKQHSEYQAEYNRQEKDIQKNLLDYLTKNPNVGNEGIYKKYNEFISNADTKLAEFSKRQLEAQRSLAANYETKINKTLASKPIYGPRGNLAVNYGIFGKEVPSDAEWSKMTWDQRADFYKQDEQYKHKNHEVMKQLADARYLEASKITGGWGGGTEYMKEFFGLYKVKETRETYLKGSKYVEARILLDKSAGGRFDFHTKAEVNEMIGKIQKDNPDLSSGSIMDAYRAQRDLEIFDIGGKGKIEVLGQGRHSGGRFRQSLQNRQSYEWKTYESNTRDNVFGLSEFRVKSELFKLDNPDTAEWIKKKNFGDRRRRERISYEAKKPNATPGAYWAAVKSSYDAYHGQRKQAIQRSQQNAKAELHRVDQVYNKYPKLGHLARSESWRGLNWQLKLKGKTDQYGPGANTGTGGGGIGAKSILSKLNLITTKPAKGNPQTYPGQSAEATKNLNLQVQKQRLQHIADAKQQVYVWGLRSGYVGVAEALVNPRSQQIYKGNKKPNPASFVEAYYGKDILHNNLDVVPDKAFYADTWKLHEGREFARQAVESGLIMGDLNRFRKTPLASWETIQKRKAFKEVTDDLFPGSRGPEPLPQNPSNWQGPVKPNKSYSLEGSLPYIFGKSQQRSFQLGGDISRAVSGPGLQTTSLLPAFDFQSKLLGDKSIGPLKTPGPNTSALESFAYGAAGAGVNIYHDFAALGSGIAAWSGSGDFADFEKHMSAYRNEYHTGDILDYAIVKGQSIALGYSPELKRYEGKDGLLFNPAWLMGSSLATAATFLSPIPYARTAGRLAGSIGGALARVKADKIVRDSPLDTTLAHYASREIFGIPTAFTPRVDKIPELSTKTKRTFAPGRDDINPKNPNNFVVFEKDDFIKTGKAPLDNLSFTIGREFATDKVDDALTFKGRNYPIDSELITSKKILIDESGKFGKYAKAEGYRKMKSFEIDDIKPKLEKEHDFKFVDLAKKKTVSVYSRENTNERVLKDVTTNWESRGIKETPIGLLSRYYQKNQKIMPRREETIGVYKIELDKKQSFATELTKQNKESLTAKRIKTELRKDNAKADVDIRPNESGPGRNTVLENKPSAGNVAKAENSRLLESVATKMDKMPTKPAQKTRIPTRSAVNIVNRIGANTTSQAKPTLAEKPEALQTVSVTPRSITSAALKIETTPKLQSDQAARLSTAVESRLETKQVPTLLARARTSTAQKQRTRQTPRLKTRVKTAQKLQPRLSLIQHTPVKPKAAPVPVIPDIPEHEQVTIKKKKYTTGKKKRFLGNTFSDTFAGFTGAKEVRYTSGKQARYADLGTKRKRKGKVLKW